jgi:ankyrin repeat protein
MMTTGEKWIIATMNNDIKKVKKIIDSGFDINYRTGHTGHGEPAIIVATMEGYDDIINLLLDHPDADINIQDIEGRTLLFYAITHARFELVKKLLEHPKIDITVKHNDILYYFAYIKKFVSLSDYESQKKILDNGREDVIILYKEMNIINEQIFEENKNLFSANDWGLI